VYMTKAFLLLFNSLLHIFISPLCLFSFMLASFSHFSNASGHLQPYVFASPPCQGSSLRTLSLKVCGDSFLSYHHFIFHTLSCLLRWIRTRKQKSTTISLCWDTTHSLGITLQFKSVCLSSLLTRMKSIWLQFWPLLKVTRWEGLFLKRVFATINS
jgi:hypothetical protein